MDGRLKKSNEMQQYADIYLLLNYSTCFGCPSCPLSGVHTTVVAVSGIDCTICGASFLKRDQIRTYLVTFEEACSSDSMICVRGCNYRFMYSRRWARWTPKTCKIIWQYINICILFHPIGFLKPRIMMHGTTNIK